MPSIRVMLAPSLASLVLFTGCGLQDTDTGSGSSADAAASSTSPTSDAPTTTSPPDQDESTVSQPSPDPATKAQVAAAIEDLAGRQNVPSDQITVVELIEVTWADGAIGCPTPGMQYSQAVVAGQLLTLAIDDSESATGPTVETFAYHAGRKGTFRYCADPQPPAMRGESSSDR
ncbi:MAG: hypothetical protein WBG57_02350 [Ornithinimicrobium sp.]